MDYPRLNSRWVYGLTLEVFFRNFFTILIIALANAGLGYAQTDSGLFGFLFIPVYLYFGVVTMIIAHKTVVSGKGVPMGEAFAISPKPRVYFLQYMGISAVPIVIIILGFIAIISNYSPRSGIENSVYLLTATAFGAYYLILAMFGTSLTATAVGGDGMMVISRGRLTFFYSLSRQIVLPTALIAAFVGGIWLYVDKLGPDEAEAMIFALTSTPLNSSITGILFIVGWHIAYVLITLVSGVILTKAFILAELKMVMLGDVSKWAVKEFGLDPESREVQFI